MPRIMAFILLLSIAFQCNYSVFAWSSSAGGHPSHQRTGQSNPDGGTVDDTPRLIRYTSGTSQKVPECFGYADELMSDQKGKERFSTKHLFGDRMIREPSHLDQFSDYHMYREDSKEDDEEKASYENVLPRRDAPQAPTLQYYKMLGVSPEASIDEIKNAFRKLARLYHPDKNDRVKDTTTMFSQLTRAYEVLSNPETRQRYDDHGRKALGTSAASDELKGKLFPSNLEVAKKQEEKEAEEEEEYIDYDSMFEEETEDIHDVSTGDKSFFASTMTVVQNPTTYAHYGSLESEDEEEDDEDEDSYWNEDGILVASFKDFYDVLIVSRDSSMEEIDEAYSILSRIYNPANNRDGDAHRRFAEISRAYEILSDPVAREKYDAKGILGIERPIKQEELTITESLATRCSAGMTTPFQTVEYPPDQIPDYYATRQMKRPPVIRSNVARNSFSDLNNIASTTISAPGAQQPFPDLGLSQQNEEYEMEIDEDEDNPTVFAMPSDRSKVLTIPPLPVADASARFSSEIAVGATPRFSSKTVVGPKKKKKQTKKVTLVKKQKVMPVSSRNSLTMPSDRSQVITIAPLPIGDITDSESRTSSSKKSKLVAELKPKSKPKSIKTTKPRRTTPKKKTKQDVAISSKLEMIMPSDRSKVITIAPLPLAHERVNAKEFPVAQAGVGTVMKSKKMTQEAPRVAPKGRTMESRTKSSSENGSAPPQDRSKVITIAPLPIAGEGVGRFEAPRSKPSFNQAKDKSLEKSPMIVAKTAASAPSSPITKGKPSITQGKHKALAKAPKRVAKTALDASAPPTKRDKPSIKPEIGKRLEKDPHKVPETSISKKKETIDMSSPTPTPLQKSATKPTKLSLKGNDTIATEPSAKSNERIHKTTDAKSTVKTPKQKVQEIKSERLGNDKRHAGKKVTETKTDSQKDSIKSSGVGAKMEPVSKSRFATYAPQSKSVEQAKKEVGKTKERGESTIAKKDSNMDTQTKKVAKEEKKTPTVDNTVTVGKRNDQSAGSMATKKVTRPSKHITSGSTVTPRLSRKLKGEEAPTAAKKTSKLKFSKASAKVLSTLAKAKATTGSGLASGSTLNNLFSENTNSVKVPRKGTKESNAG